MQITIPSLHWIKESSCTSAHAVEATTTLGLTVTGMITWISLWPSDVVVCGETGLVGGHRSCNKR